MTHTYQVRDVRVALDAADAEIAEAVAQRMGCSADDLLGVEVIQRSIDSRGRRAPVRDLLVRVELAGPLPGHREGVTRWAPPELEPLPTPSGDLAHRRVVIVGAGPCGLFAALALIERGIRPTLLDRGEAVDGRAKTVSRLMGRGELNLDSNLCYGEGGAGTFSDGKLYTRIGGPDVPRVLHTMVKLGAPRDILMERRPHLGTDRLIRLLKGIRARLEQGGADLRFGARVDGIEVAGERGAIVLGDGERLEADDIVLAPGHSARGLYRHLRSIGVAMETKPFAVGFRVEHPQALINSIQYGPYAEKLAVPAAEYRVAYNRSRGEIAERVYSFCMCPGGSVVPTATCEGEVSVNGMSHAARSGHYANSALVTEVHPEELASDGDPLLCGVRFQERAERTAYELGGGAFKAPASRLIDYLEGRASGAVRRTTYRRGVTPADLSACFPELIGERLRAGIRHFEERLKGFISEEAVLIGVETRTSSPIRILRDGSCRSPTHPFLYPAGEGAGYAGGIASAAVDGLRIARAILGRQ